MIIKNKKGFTLIEILAVIIIIGILMIITIPAVTNYINSSRKSAYADDVIAFLDNIKAEYDMKEYGSYLTEDEIMLVPFEFVSFEKGNNLSSPFADYVLDKSYAVVVPERNGYQLYANVVDNSGNGVILKSSNELNKEAVENGIKNNINTWKYYIANDFLYKNESNVEIRYHMCEMRNIKTEEYEYASVIILCTESTQGNTQGDNPSEPLPSGDNNPGPLPPEDDDPNPDPITPGNEVIPEPDDPSKVGFLASQTSSEEITFNHSIRRDKFEEIYTVNYNEVPSNALASWDASAQNNGTVMAWYFDNNNNGLYELYLGQKDGIVANPNSNYTFAGFVNVSKIDLSNFITSAVSNVTYGVVSMASMFYNAAHNTSTFNIVGLSALDTSNVTNMNRMFMGFGSSSNSWVLNLSSWNVSKVNSMSEMFRNAGYRSSNFELNVSNWKTGSVSNMSHMFEAAGYNENKSGTRKFRIIGLNEWNTHWVNDMSYMFHSAGTHDTDWIIGDISNWDTSGVLDMNHMFSYAAYDAGLQLSFTNWEVWKVKNMSSMFENAGAGGSIFMLGGLDSWRTWSATDMSNMFSHAGIKATTWTIGSISNWYMGNVTNVSNMFYFACGNASNCSMGSLAGWDVSNVTDMSGMFYNYGAVANETGLVLTYWDTSNVTNMSNMFRNSFKRDYSWVVGDLSNWNVSKVTDMSYMFSGAGVSSIDSTFVGNQGLLYVGNLTNWNTISTTNLEGMFSQIYCQFNIGGFNVKAASNIDRFFEKSPYAVATFNVLNTPTSNINVFTGASSQPNKLITVYYANPVTRAKIDEIINTKNNLCQADPIFNDMCGTPHVTLGSENPLW